MLHLNRTALCTPLFCPSRVTNPKVSVSLDTQNFKLKYLADFIEKVKRTHREKLALTFLHLENFNIQHFFLYSIFMHDILSILNPIGLK